MDRIERIAGLIDRRAPSDEESERERAEQARWNEAMLTCSQEWGPTYAATLSKKGDNASGVFAWIDCFAGRPVIEIPFGGGTSDEILKDVNTQAAFPGALDEEFAATVTQRLVVARFQGYLNRQIAGAKGGYPSGRWFYNTFDVDDRHEYGSVQVDSRGSSSSVRIGTNAKEWVLQEDVVDFARKVNGSFPNIELSPLSRDDYVRIVEAELLLSRNGPV